MSVDLPEPVVRPIRYEVSILSEDDINYPFHRLDVVYVGDGKWAIRHLDSASVDSGGAWSDGVKSHGRKGWSERHRMDLDTALRIAREIAPGVICSGITAADAYRRTHPTA